MGNTTPEISVIMPVYNAGKYLRSAIESILTQDFENFELILVDDGSTDGSADICDYFSNTDDRVLVIHQKNGGICNARNNAIKVARGAYLSFCDHDDVFLPGLLSAAYSTAVYSGADVVKFGKKVVISKDGDFIRERSNSLQNHTFEQNEIRESFLSFFYKLKINCVWDGLFKKELFCSNDILFDEFYKYGGEDYDIMSRYLSHVTKLVTLKECYYAHFIRKELSTSVTFKEYKLKHVVRLTNTIIEEAKKIGYEFAKKTCETDYFLTEFFVNTMACLLANPLCSFNSKEKLSLLSSLKEESCMKEFFGKSSFWEIMQISKKIGLSFFLYKKGFYRTLLLIHRIRIWQSYSSFF